MSIKFHHLRKNLFIVLSIKLLFGCATSQAQRTGDSARISIGIVERAEQVPLKSDVNRNALIGGAVGWALARNRSSGTQAAAALGGAALGGAGTSRVEGSNMAMQYTVRTTGGSLIQVITDQTEIRIGDCVLVEETGSNANVRRKDPALCRPANEQVMSAVRSELHQDADQCSQAKKRLFEAQTAEEVEVARQVMEILCND